MPNIRVGLKCHDYPECNCERRVLPTGNSHVGPFEDEEFCEVVIVSNLDKDEWVAPSDTIKAAINNGLANDSDDFHNRWDSWRAEKGWNRSRTWT